MAIVLAFLIALFGFFMSNKLSCSVAMAFSSGLLVAGIGFWDDHVHVPARWRFLVHMLSAFIVMFFLNDLPVLKIVDFKWLGYGVAALFLVWLLNLYNFMDGIDGIAASEAVFVSLSLAGFLYLVDIELSRVALMIAFSTFGFLLWNWPPAKIFMGDVGSGFLGFILGILILESSRVNPVFLYMGMILLAVFVVDASYTLLYRFFSGQKWYEAHCCHAYQHAAKKYGHLKVVAVIWAINLFILLPVSLFVFRHPAFTFAALFGTYFALTYLAVRLGAGRVKVDV